MKRFNTRLKAGLLAAVMTTSVISMGASVAQAAPPSPSVTLTATAAGTGSTTTVAAGGSINYVANMAGQGDSTLTSTIPAGQTLDPASVKMPTGWASTSTSASLDATGPLSDAANGLFPGTSEDVARTMSSTNSSGGDGWVPIPYKSDVFGVYHYTLDGGFKGADPAIWSINKTTGAMARYNFGMGQQFLTPWVASPTIVGSKIFQPGFHFMSVPSAGGTYDVGYGYGCFDMATKAPCPQSWYELGVVRGLKLTHSKRIAVFNANPMMLLNGLGSDVNGTSVLTVKETSGSNPVIKTVRWTADGIPVVQTSSTAQNLSDMFMQTLSADGKRIYTTRAGSSGTGQAPAQLYCTEAATGAACAGWTNPTSAAQNGTNAKLTMFDQANAICVEDNKAGDTYKCFDGATGTQLGGALPTGIQNIAGPMFRTDSTGTRQYFGPAYDSANQILCMMGGNPCPGFGTNGNASVAGIGTNYKTYGVAADDVLPTCMWMIGDSGELYPFDSMTGAAGCKGMAATAKVVVPKLWCDGKTGHVRGFDTLTFTGAPPTGSVHVRVTRDGQSVNGWTDKVMPAAASLDLSAVPYVDGGTYEVTVTSDTATAAGTPGIVVKMDMDAAQVCYTTVVQNDCAVASPAKGTVSLKVGAAAAVASNTTSLNVTTDPVQCANASIVGGVYEDPNNNGVRDPGENPIPGTKVELLDSTGALISAEFTAADGSYSFTGLPAGSYSVREVQPAGYLDGKEAAGTHGGTVTNDLVSGITLAAGDAATGYDFFELKAAAGITVVKKINGDDSNTAPGVKVDAGSTMAITFDVTNSGNVALTGVKVTDDKVAAASITCHKTTLAVNETMQCTASLAAPAPGVQHTNTATAEGTSPVGTKVSDTDPANAVVAAAPAIEVVKKINGDDSNTAPGVKVDAGSTMAITFDVENTGNVALTGVKVTDDKVAAASISCPKTALAVGEKMQCTASLAAPAPGVQHTNTGTAQGTAPDGTKVNDTDPANAYVLGSASISGKVMHDKDYTDTVTNGDLGIPGVSVELLDGTGAVVKTTTTDADGAWSFTDLTPGTYSVREVQPAGYVDGKEIIGTGAKSNGNTDTNDVFAAVVLESGNAATGFDFLEQTFTPVKLTKMGPDGQPMGGSTWALYSSDPAAGGQPIADGVKADSQGSADFSSAALRYDAQYWLVETKAPAGTQLLPEPVSFKVDRASGVQILAGGATTSVSTSDNLRLLVSNVTGVRLPESGGLGASQLSLGALSLLLAATTYLLAVRRRQGAARQ